MRHAKTRASGLVTAVGALAGVLFAALPGVASAAEGGRALDTPGDTMTAVLATLGGIAAVFLIAALGYLYRAHRGLEWDFQQPDAAHGDEHGSGHDDHTTGLGADHRVVRA